MHPGANRSPSAFPARHQSMGGGIDDRGEGGGSWVSGGGGGGVRVASPLFRKPNNNAQPGLQAMRQFVADAGRNAGSSSLLSSTSSSARPRTTGSLGQSVVAARRQSMGSIRSTHANRPPSGHQQQQPPQQQQPCLTRNLTLGDLRWTASAAVAAIAGGANASGADGGGGGSGGVTARRGWQAGVVRGGSGIDGGGAHQPVAGDSSYRLQSGSAEAPSGDALSRLPLLESPSPPGKLQQQPHQQQHQQLLQGNAHVSVENSDLSEHGLSFGLSALKGRRPYMEDEFKVRIHGT